MTDDEPRTTGFTVGASGEPDAIDLELASLGAAPPAALPAIALAAKGRLRAVQADLDAHRAHFEAARPPLTLPVAAPAARRRWWTGALVGAVALAAALLVGVAITPPDAPTPAGVRAMGGLPVDLVVQRGGAPAADGSFRAGDDLFLRLVAPRDGVLRVLTVQADGAVSVLEPGRRLRSGERFALDGAARLDDHVGKEWLVVTLDPDDRAPTDPAGLLPDPTAHAGPRTWVVDVTRSR
jgi:hypothetical protein